MGQFSMEKPVAPGSALSGNQQLPSSGAPALRASGETLNVEASRSTSQVTSLALDQPCCGGMSASRISAAAWTRERAP
jgi:hypothetical protein